MGHTRMVFINQPLGYCLDHHNHFGDDLPQGLKITTLKSKRRLKKAPLLLLNLHDREEGEEEEAIPPIDGVL